MLLIENTLVSDDLLNKHFVCDLNACKGACCEEGDLGAPLELEEIDDIERNLEVIKQFMSPKGLALLQTEGFYELAPDQDLVTTTIEGKECVFAVKDQKGTWQCAIELANAAGKSDFLKPISCHLYPIRIEKLKNYDALNYHQWNICAAACACGVHLQVPVYKFLKGPLIRKYGQDWFDLLDGAANALSAK